MTPFGSFVDPLVYWSSPRSVDSMCDKRSLESSTAMAEPLASVARKGKEVTAELTRWGSIAASVWESDKSKRGVQSFAAASNRGIARPGFGKQVGTGTRRQY